jgi:DNA-binding NarL/FixJ family response regulator
MIKLFIVDDHQLVREGIISLVKEIEEYFEFIGEAENGKDALLKLDNLEELPDIILMDINMPKMNGIECTAKLSSEYPDIKVIALSMIKQSAHIRKMLKAGAVGYILKDCDKEELKEALLAVDKGKAYFSPAVSQEVMHQFTRINKEPIDREVLLSPREKEVLDLIVKDLSNQEIADQLHISIRTVETHKQNLLRKTGTNSVAGLVVFAIRNNLVELYE